MIKTYAERTDAERAIIRAAYDFEIEAIEKDSSERNPYRETLKAMGLWEYIEEAVEMKYRS